MPRKENAEARKEREQQKVEELRERRSHQLTEARSAAEQLDGDIHKAYTVLRRSDALASHSAGFYEEVNKLAKTKILLGVTDRMVEEANNIIRDAKGIIKDDIYLDRIKEFVPAGDNPVYPDVVVSIRAVRDSLDRFHRDLEVQIKSFKESLQKARTVAGALEFFLDDQVEDEDDKNCPTKEALERYVEGNVSDSCLSRSADSYDKYFDFDRLDKQTIRVYLSMDENNQAQGADIHEKVDEGDNPSDPTEWNESEEDVEEDIEE